MSDERQRPEWAPDGADPHHFTSFVMKGVDGGHDGLPGQVVAPSRPVVKPRRKLTTEDYIAGVLAGDRTILARAITLIESQADAHQAQAQEVLKAVLPKTGNSIRIGITGVPGVGKSTFIEAFGSMLCDQGRQVAVLAIDPSSAVTGGSVLGDKTRMEKLSRHPNAFIRPSPAGSTLGGVARKTRETLLLCEAAGFDTILVETVGVGQSEVTVRFLVDFFLLLMLAGQGDELQGIKKGVVEIADAIFVNKCDGANRPRALAKQAEMAGVLHFLHPATEGWKSRAGICSASTGEHIDEVWKTAQEFLAATRESGVFERRRREQAIHWMHSLIRDYLDHLFYQNPCIADALPRAEDAISRGRATPSTAANDLLDRFRQSLKEGLS